MSLYTKDYSSDFYPAMPVVDILVKPEVNEHGINLTAIVDSGADNTMLPANILDQLNVSKTQTAWMTGVSGSRVAVNLYWIFVQIGDFQPIYTEVIGIQNRDEVIIGRDIINQFAVLLNGPAHTIEIS